MRTCLLFLLLSGFLHANRVVPPVHVEINDPFGVGVPVTVNLLGRKIYSFKYSEFDTREIRAGRADTFDGFRTKTFGWLVLHFQWTPPGSATRELMYEVRVRRGKKVSGGRSIKPGGEQSVYVFDGLRKGDCSQLFGYEQDPDGSLRVRFSIPRTYVPCESNKSLIADVGSIGQRNINQGKLNYYKFPDDQRMGAEFFNNLKNSRENPPLNDRPTTEYVQGLIDKIGRNSDMPDLKFTATVIDADVLNAFAVPGGYIWVYRGLIEQTETEAELVGVLAHEIAHVTSRHGTEGMTSAITKVATGLVIGEVLANQTDDAEIAALIQTLVTGGTQFWIMGGTRVSEAEADRLGAQYAWRAGYDPVGLVTLFQRWGQERGQKTRLDEFFSEHPNDLNRAANVQRDIDYFLPPKDNLIVTSKKYERIKRRLRSLPPPKVGGQAAGQAMFSAFAASNEALLQREIGAWLEAEAAKEEEDQ